MKATRFAALLLAPVVAGNAYADNAGVKVNASLTGSSGAEVFSHICQGCHMPDAQGASGAGHYPKLAGDPALGSWQYVAVTVLLGRHAMPAFGKPADPAFVFGEVHISDQEIADVVNYVRSHFGNRYKAEATAAKIAALPHPDN
ncbi:MAG: c-type cytochrome [Steroidobacterales bacterium]